MLDSQLEQIFRDRVEKSFYNKEIWVVRLVGNIITLSSGNNTWGSETSARRSWSYHLSRIMSKITRFDSTIWKYITLNQVILPNGMKNKDFTNWLENKGWLKFERIK